MAAPWQASPSSGSWKRRPSPWEAAASAAAGKAALLLMAADLSEKTAKELRYAAREKKIPLARMPLNKEETGAACGFQKPVGVLATEDRGFATAMGRHCLHDLEEDTAI